MKSLLLVALMVSISQAFACKCSETWTVRESFKYVPIIISGKVLKRKVVSFAEMIRTDKLHDIEKDIAGDSQKLKMFEMNFIFEVQFLVTERFKELNIPDTITIYTTITSGSCGFRFEEGKEYIVYGTKKGFYPFMLTEVMKKEMIERENTYWTTHCTRTQLYNDLEAKELRTLRKRME
ncbi:hypothetical protein ACFQ21_11590 [Ohtaekwangia kribbensis]|uniref:Tissue inhibitor of metalloproteinase n=1 Tax=Ohtaekwangia kribbensis TaxID=688913 RepID=A0ABW3K223_9BACT